jgi:hypothetical protein
MQRNRLVAAVAACAAIVTVWVGEALVLAGSIAS